MSQAIYFLRHEILLAVLLVVLLLADLGESRNRNGLILFVIIAFALINVVGWFPFGDAELFGGMYRHDGLRVLMKNMLSLFAFVVVLQSADWLMMPKNQTKTGAFFFLVFSTLMGMDLMISSGDFIILYLGLELATLPLTMLAAFDKDLRRSAEAGVKLLMSSAVSSALLLFGLSWIYGAAGSLHYVLIPAPTLSDGLFLTGMLFFVAGLGFKLSLVPFHWWTADVYEGSPLPVTAYFSVVSKGAALFALVLVMFEVFQMQSAVWMTALAALAVITMLVGNLFAIRQRVMKRFMAFSSITQAGFMLLGFLTSDRAGLVSVVYFMLVYGLSNLAVMGVLGVVYRSSGRETMDDLNGFYKTNPGLSIIMLVALFSLAGIPPVAGFFGKFFLFTSAASAGRFWLVFFAVANATISLYYYLLVVRAMFIQKSDNPVPALAITWRERAAFVICVAGIVVVGFASGVYDYILAQALSLN